MLSGLWIHSQWSCMLRIQEFSFPKLVFNAHCCGCHILFHMAPKATYAPASRERLPLQPWHRGSPIPEVKWGTPFWVTTAFTTWESRWGLCGYNIGQSHSNQHKACGGHAMVPALQSSAYKLRQTSNFWLFFCNFKDIFCVNVAKENS